MIKHNENLTQSILAYTYEQAMERMKQNPSVAKERNDEIAKQKTFKSEQEAIKRAENLKVESGSIIQIWAKVSKDEEYYFLEDFWIVTDDNIIKLYAEYIGMALVYSL